MMHHTKTQIAAAFARAPAVLEELQAAGVDNPRFELYADASGRLYLGEEGKVTLEQYTLAGKLLRTARPYEVICLVCYDAEVKGQKPREHKHSIGLTFCCGLVPEGVE